MYILQGVSWEVVPHWWHAPHAHVCQHLRWGQDMPTRPLYLFNLMLRVNKTLNSIYMGRTMRGSSAMRDGSAGGQEAAA
jgi:hypothetical protein